MLSIEILNAAKTCIVIIVQINYAALLSDILNVTLFYFFQWVSSNAQ